MQKKPIIGINGDYRQGKPEQTALSWFNTGYYDSITAAGGLPVLIPPFAADDDLKQILRTVEGVVLAGCSMDLDPVRLGFERHPHTRPMPTRREDFDRRLAKAAVEMRLPILAIGSGMQVLNVVCGGTLYQHVSEEVVKALHHRDGVERQNRHIINIVEGTRCWDVYGPGEIRVNSEHHMAVNRLAPLFKASAHAPDGVIECYESVEENWFCMGVQWHPESETSSALDMQIFQEFMASCGCAEAQILKMPVRAAA
ncbi:gamma-glutamyl-gamma-aminobutyrate hydrolase family protein [Candidatus Woesearchaeota archaeon]|nr:gamma-glutamyl-gamma-aminobutyrate hydrolase family protein [Candidatus Woesearchaeota archaeon]MBM4074320.1 gamma-glutamyl-gamma-aminobutyrate hydrolase family protein [Planctomycetota bacterium]